MDKILYNLELSEEELEILFIALEVFKYGKLNNWFYLSKLKHLYRPTDEEIDNLISKLEG